jgi:adenylate cyclase
VISLARRHGARVVLGLLVVAVAALHATHLITVPGLAQLERWLYDLRVTAAAEARTDERVVIVDVDERSLAEVGRWPWRRDLVAHLVDQLFERHRATVVGFDVVFAEPDTSSGLEVLDALSRGSLKEVPDFRRALEALRPELDHDARLARAFADRPVVLGFYFSSTTDARTAGVLSAPAIDRSVLAGHRIAFTTWTGFGGNLPVLQKAAVAGGHFNAISDPDGLTRRVPMLVEHDGQYYEALSLAVARRATGAPEIRPEFGAARPGRERLEWLRAGRLRVPVDDNVAAFVPFRGPVGGFRYVSAVDVLKERVPAEEIGGRIVLVGTSAPGLYDLRSTPVGSVFPGVEIHANLIAGMLDGRLKAQPGWLVMSVGLFTLAVGIGFAFWMPRMSPARVTAATGAAFAAIASVSWAFWQLADLAVPLATLVAVIAGLFVLNVILGYFVEARTKRQFASLFGQYVPPALVERMARDPDKYTTEPRSEVLTVLFADLRGFTSVSETLEPNDVRRFLNDYLTAMTQVIHQAQGTVDKYIGDAIMAFWGAPVADPEHARHAVLAAMHMQDAVRRIQQEGAGTGLPMVNVGVGINTGLVSVGDMGSRLRRSYTVLGDPVNLASRLESLTKYYGVGIVIGERTRELVPELVCRELDRVRVKGRGEAVSIHEPLGFRDAVEPEALEELALWNAMLRAYRARDWDQAEVAVLNLQRMHRRETLYALYLSRIVRYRAAPPPEDWGGVTVFDRK